ncbi:hypothetical protein CBS12448_8831 [Aspergillus niger]|nr:hypothetical protein CBS133816_8881 [Aspergillus niger]KAI2849745.1 hypothetical protein CBS12448_8831 [Aspergillus niger]
MGGDRFFLINISIWPRFSLPPFNVDFGPLSAFPLSQHHSSPVQGRSKRHWIANWFVPVLLFPHSGAHPGLPAQASVPRAKAFTRASSFGLAFNLAPAITRLHSSCLPILLLFNTRLSSLVAVH